MLPVRLRWAVPATVGAGLMVLGVLNINFYFRKTDAVNTARLQVSTPFTMSRYPCGRQRGSSLFPRQRLSFHRNISTRKNDLFRFRIAKQRRNALRHQHSSFDRSVFDRRRQ